MSRPNVEFTSTSDFLPSWNCMSKGSTKENNLEWLKPTEESWLCGYYISMKDVTIKDRPYKKIIMRATHVGNNEHLRDIESVSEQGTDVEILSTGVLTNKIEESVQPGQYIEIKYLGKVPKKSNPAESYHNWNVGIAGSVEPLVVQNGIVVGDANSSQNEMAQPVEEPQGDTMGKTDPSPAAAEGDDDLPF